MLTLPPLHALRRLFFLLCGPAVALALATSPAWPLDSGWAETQGGRMRLLVDPSPREDGTFAGVLDIALEPGWKTYWRDPGSAGIPPTLDLSQSKGVALEAMLYPPPVRVDDGYAVWAGYTAPVMFPLIFRPTASGDAQIRALAFVGICEKICIPFQAELVVDLPQGAAASDAAKPAIQEAFARLPEEASADFNLEDAVFDADGKQLEIAANLPAFRPSGVKPELFVAGPKGFAFAPPVLVSDEGGRARWTVRIEDMPDSASAVAPEAFDIVVTLGQRAIEQNVPANRDPR